MSLRVIAGAHGGRRLRTPRGSDTRPTAERVREALFSILGPLDGARVLDLFAGSGALGIEALSRGASEATFVDRSPVSVQAVRANLDTIGAEGAVHRRDGLAFLRDAAGRAHLYDLVLLDPPYRQGADLGEPLGEALGPVLAPGARVVAEGDRRGPLRLPFPVLTQRTYGDTLLTLHLIP